jgi:tetratricopeptide (TPR) repeat protein
MDTALKATEEALALRPGDHDALCLRGTVRWRAREFAGAVEDLKAALQADEDDVETRIALIRALLDLGEPEEALEHLRIAVQAPPEFGSDLSWLMGDAELAIGDRSAIHVDEAEARTHWNNAVQNLEQALHDRPENSAARRSLALARHRLGQSEKALAELQGVLDQDSDDITAHAYRAEILMDAGRSAEALKAVNSRRHCSAELTCPPQSAPALWA